MDCIISLNCVRVISSRTITAELLERPRCGLSTNQLPVFAVIISSSSAEKRQIVADRRTPPAKTASAACIAISYTSIARRRFSPFRIRDWIRCSILSNAFRKGSGPGALNPPLIIAPLGRTCCRSKYTLRPAISGNC